MKKKRFDPFNDRESRNIRNGLSSALTKAIQTRNPDTVREKLEQCAAEHTGEIYQEYINDRSRRFESVLRAICKNQTDNILEQGVLLWNEHLFFEFHELLEGRWLKAQGRERVFLQGLIRAAGTYIHLAQGNMKGAGKMSRKAMENLSDPPIPQEIKNLDELIGRLERLDLNPPVLVYRGKD